MIVGVAVSRGELTLSMPAPFRHCDVIQRAVSLGLDCPIRSEEQGFLTSGGVFVDRVKAAEIAVVAGQVARLPQGRLTSEDLW